MCCFAYFSDVPSRTTAAAHHLRQTCRRCLQPLALGPYSLLRSSSIHHRHLHFRCRFHTDGSVADLCEHKGCVDCSWIPLVLTRPHAFLMIHYLSIQHRRMVKFAKGYRGRSKNCFRIAIRAVTKAWTYAYRDRRTKKRVWRRLWIQRLNAATRQYAVSYSSFIYRLKTADIELNRKVLSELAATEPFAFKACVDVVERQNRLYVEEKRRQKQLEETHNEAIAA